MQDLLNLKWDLLIVLTLRGVELSRRTILIGPENSKRGQWNGIPIRKDVFPILDKTMKLKLFKAEKLFGSKSGSQIQILKKSLKHD